MHQRTLALLLLTFPAADDTRRYVTTALRTGQHLDADDLAAAERPLHGVHGGAPVQPSVAGLHPPQGQLGGIQHPVLALGGGPHRETHTHTHTHTNTGLEFHKLD